MPRVPKEHVVSEEKKRRETWKMLISNLQDVCRWFDDCHPVVTREAQGSRKKGDYRWTVQLLGLKEEEVLTLVEQLKGCRVEK